VEWYELRGDRPWDDLLYKIRRGLNDDDGKTITLDRGWVYSSKHHTLRLVRTNDELNDALHNVKEPVIRLDASGLDILDHEDIEKAPTPPELSPKKTALTKNSSSIKKSFKKNALNELKERKEVLDDEDEGSKISRVSIEEITHMEKKGDGSSSATSENVNNDAVEKALVTTTTIELVEAVGEKKDTMTQFINSKLPDPSRLLPLRQQTSSTNRKVDVLVSFDNEANIFHLRIAKPWDDLIVGLKETFVVDEERGCFTQTVKGPSLDGIEGLYFDGKPDAKGEYKCTKVDSNETLSIMLQKAAAAAAASDVGDDGKRGGGDSRGRPRLLVYPKKVRRRHHHHHRRNNNNETTGTCPLFGCNSGNRKEKAYFTRWMFRWTHIPMFYIVAILYTIHAQDIFPIVIIIVWTYCYRSRVLPVEKILYTFSHRQNKCARFANIHDEYLLNLRIKLANSVVPDKYGYYVVLGRDTRVCSYTMVPAEGGSEIRLTIKHCTFIDSVLDQIAANENTVDVEELAKTGQTWYNLGRGFFKVYGPFMSCDHTIANAERVAVLVQTTGSVVSDTVISFQNIRKYWDKVVVFAVGSALMNYDGDSNVKSSSVNNKGEQRQETTIFTNTDVQNWSSSEQKYKWIMNRIDREIAGDQTLLPMPCNLNSAMTPRSPPPLEEDPTKKFMENKIPYWPDSVSFKGKVSEDDFAYDNDNNRKSSVFQCF